MPATATATSAAAHSFACCTTIAMHRHTIRTSYHIVIHIKSVINIIIFGTSITFTHTGIHCHPYKCVSSAWRRCCRWQRTKSNINYIWQTNVCLADKFWWITMKLVRRRTKPFTRFQCILYYYQSHTHSHVDDAIGILQCIYISEFFKSIVWRYETFRYFRSTLA